MGSALPRILITAGPTREYIDPVRFISNPSSGKMGLAIAKEAQKRGCKVLMILGPTSLDAAYIKTIRVIKAQEMFQEVRKYFNQYDVLIMTAAVCDYRPKFYSKKKIKKDRKDKVITLIPNVDIIAWASQHKKDQMIVGFAAETQRAIENAKEKLLKKKMDIIIANRVGRKKIGFESDNIEFTILERNEKYLSLRVLSKEKVAQKIMDLIMSKRKSLE